MSQDFLFEIEGINTAWVGAGRSDPPKQWGQDIEEAIIDIPPEQTLSVDIYTGDFENGGLGLVSVKSQELLTQFKKDIYSTTTSSVGISDTSVSILNTSTFPSSGYAWIDKEAISYTGKTSTSLTGCTRGVLGTVAASHDLTTGAGNTKVYGYNPLLLGRKCYLTRYSSAADYNRIFTGYIDSVSFSESGFSLGLINMAQKLNEKIIATGTQTKGTFLGGRVRGNNTLKPLGVEKYINVLEIGLESEEEYFKVSYGSVGFILVGTELIKWLSSDYPAVSATVKTTGLSYGGNNGFSIEKEDILIDDTIKFVDSSTSETVYAKVTHTQKNITSGYFEVFHGGGNTNPSTGDTVTTPLRQTLSVLFRGSNNTDVSEHNISEEVSEVFVFEGDSVDLTLRLLLSGGGTSSYDVYSSDIGACLTTDEIDVDSFDSLRLYSIPKTFIIKEPISPRKILKDLAHTTGGRLFINKNGKVFCNKNWAIYPGNTTNKTISVTSLKEGSVPSWSVSFEKIFNSWVWPLKDGKQNIKYPESIALYGERNLESPETNHSSFGVSSAVIMGVALPILYRFSSPTPEIGFYIPHDPSSILEPGETITATLPVLPDLKGNSGFTSKIFEVVEYNAEDNGYAFIKAIESVKIDNVGVVAPAGQVLSWDATNKWVILDTNSVTHFSPDQDRSTSFEEILGAGETGEENSDWFLAGDTLKFWDVSSFGGTVQTSSNTVVSIDYSLRKITFSSSLPSWLAVGDLIRLDDYTTVNASVNDTLRTLWFAALSEDYYWGV